jgi:hypothetical protein
MGRIGHASGLRDTCELESVSWEFTRINPMRNTAGMWMRSLGHKQNMLSAIYCEIGIGIAWDKLDRRYDVHVLGSPLTGDRK